MYSIFLWNGQGQHLITWGEAEFRIMLLIAVIIVVKLWCLCTKGDALTKKYKHTHLKQTNKQTSKQTNAVCVAPAGLTSTCVESVAKHTQDSGLLMVLFEVECS